MMGLELSKIDAGINVPDAWSIDSKRSVTERRSGRWNVQFHHVPAAVISQVGWHTPIVCGPEPPP